MGPVPPMIPTPPLKGVLKRLPVRVRQRWLGPPQLSDLPYRDVSTEVVDLKPVAGPGLALDETHTLAGVETEDREALWRPNAGAALSWLLFRSGSTDRSQGTRADDRPPELWFEVDGRRVVGELRESAGWSEPGAAAVALFEVSARASSASPRDCAVRATCGIRVAEVETSVELPARWAERIGAVPGDLA